MWRLILALGLLAVSSFGANASVVLTFYSHEFRSEGREASFPHAFVALRGTVGPNNKPVKASYGFTAVSVSPAILLKPVGGHVVSEQDEYIARSHRHFSVPISDAQYQAVLAVVERWRARAQPSYSLDSDNCITFVKEIALAARLPAGDARPFIRSPKEYLDDLRVRVGRQGRH